jgi:hypothetical protein
VAYHNRGKVSVRASDVRGVVPCTIMSRCSSQRVSCPPPPPVRRILHPHPHACCTHQPMLPSSGSSPSRASPVSAAPPALQFHTPHGSPARPSAPHCSTRTSGANASRTRSTTVLQTCAMVRHDVPSASGMLSVYGSQSGWLSFSSCIASKSESESDPPLTSGANRTLGLVTAGFGLGGAGRRGSAASGDPGKNPGAAWCTDITKTLLAAPERPRSGRWNACATPSAKCRSRSR